MSTLDNIPLLPEGHDGYNHRHFPVGDNIICKIYKTGLVLNNTTGNIELRITCKYGPYKVKRPTAGKETLTILIKRKLFNVYYTIDNIYELIDMLMYYGVESSKINIPEVGTNTDTGIKIMFKYIAKLIDQTLIKNSTNVYVDTEGYAYTVGTKYHNYIITKEGTRIKYK